MPLRSRCASNWPSALALNTTPCLKSLIISLKEALIEAEPSRQDKMRDAFLVIGSQYFAQARYSSIAFYLPVSATLFHHAIEMLLKGYLSYYKSSAELKRIGHNLTEIWEMFKQQVGDSGLSCFDSTIMEIDKVELLRYPDAIVDEGYILHVSLGNPVVPLAFPDMDKVPNYYVYISDLDAIAEKVFAACSVSPVPYFKGAPTEFLMALPPNLRGLL